MCEMSRGGPVTALSCRPVRLFPTPLMESPLDIPVFYARSEFLDVDGVPVSIGNCDSDDVPACAAWDISPPRPADPAWARSTGGAISQTRFHTMVTAVFAGV